MSGGFTRTHLSPRPAAASEPTNGDPLQLTPEFVDALEWDAVVSSNVLRIAWTETSNVTLGLGLESTGDLYVDFGIAGAPKLYRYSGVPVSRFAAVRGAASVGGMINKLVKPNHAVDRVEIVPADAKVLDVEDIWDAFHDVIAGLEAINTRLANLERGLAFLLRTQPQLEEEHG
jgi:hypothetical protein